MDFRNGDAGHDAEVPSGEVQVSSSDVDTAPALEKAGEVLAKAMADTAAKKPLSSKDVAERRFDIVTDASRDARLTEFGKETLQDRYLLPGESYQDLFARVADAYADDQEHAQRLYDYISKLWFMPATPVLSNGGTGRGLPISCYLNSRRRQPGRHRLDLERERVAGLARRRHRHLLGQCARDRRAGRPQRQDQRDHSVRAGDGFADAGDFAGFAAARVGGLLHRRAPPGDRGIPRDPHHHGRFQPQGAEPASRRAA